MKRRCNAGPSRRQERPCNPTKSSWSTPGSAWPPCSRGVCPALWRGWRATLRPDVTSCPPTTGRGRRPTYGARVRPLPRTHKGKTIAATPPDATAQWVVAGRIVHAQVWDNLVLATAKPGAAAFRCVVIHDPRYQEPLVLATNLPVSAYALWCLYRDRWPMEQFPWRPSRCSGRTGRLCSVKRAATAYRSWRCWRAMS